MCAVEGCGFARPALADYQVPGKHVQGVTRLLEVGTPQHIHGLLPLVLERTVLFQLLCSHVFRHGLVLLDYLVHEALLTAAEHQLSQEQDTDQDPHQAQQDEGADPLGPSQEQDEEENEEDHDDDRGGQHEELDEFEQ